MATIAFLGLGHMGGPMAANLAAAGHTVRGFDPMPASREAAEAKGIKVFGTGARPRPKPRWSSRRCPTATS